MAAGAAHAMRKRCMSRVHAHTTRSTTRRRLRYLTLTNCELLALPPVVRGLAGLRLLKLNINRLQVTIGCFGILFWYLPALECVPAAEHRGGCVSPARAAAHPLPAWLVSWHPCCLSLPAACCCCWPAVETVRSVNPLCRADPPRGALPARTGMPGDCL